MSKTSNSLKHARRKLKRAAKRAGIIGWPPDNQAVAEAIVNIVFLRRQAGIVSPEKMPGPAPDSPHFHRTHLVSPSLRERAGGPDDYSACYEQAHVWKLVRNALNGRDVPPDVRQITDMARGLFEYAELSAFAGPDKAARTALMTDALTRHCASLLPEEETAKRFWGPVPGSTGYTMTGRTSSGGVHFQQGAPLGQPFHSPARLGRTQRKKR